MTVYKTTYTVEVYHENESISPFMSFEEIIAEATDGDWCSDISCTGTSVVHKSAVPEFFSPEFNGY